MRRDCYLIDESLNRPAHHILERLQGFATPALPRLDKLPQEGHELILAAVLLE
jgi:hypothetical protein